MVYNPIPIGALSWGGDVNDAFTDQDQRIADLEAGGVPAAQAGFLAMPYAPELATLGTVATSGTIYMTQVILPTPQTLTTLTAVVATAGATLTVSNNFGGIYNASGVRVAVTGDQTAVWTSTGEKNMALSIPYAAPAGAYWLALLSNGTTPPAFARSVSATTSANVINHGMGAAVARYTTGPTGAGVLPSNVTMSARTLSGTAYWLGVS